MAKGEDIQERLIAYAARIIRVTGALPKIAAGHLLHSGTAPAAHYAGGHSAESPADFVHQLKIAVKELNESEVWLRIIVASDMLPQYKAASLLGESDQRQRFLSASIKTARKSAH